MGCGGSKTADELTVDLWNLIEKKLTKYDSPTSAQYMLAGGASIRQARADGRYMLEEVRDQEKRNRQANRISEANNCERVAQHLITRANTLLVEAVGQGRLAEVQLLAQKLGGDLHQGESLGQLGLMPVALKSPNVNLPLVQFLVDSDARNRAAIGLAVTATSPPAPLHKACADQQISAYLLHQLSLLLLELPSTVAAGQGNDGAAAERLVNSAEAMIKQGANPTLVDAQGNNVLCRAVVLGHVPLTRRLLHLGLDSTYVNPSTGLSVLQLAESQSHRDPVLIALLKGHTFNLHFQQRIHAMRDQKDGLEYDAWHTELQGLLTQGADIHCLNSQQETPLHLLVQSLAQVQVQAGEDDEGVDARLVRMFLADFHADAERSDLASRRPVETAILLDRNLRVLRELLEVSDLRNAKTNMSVLAFARAAPESEHKEATIALIQAFLNARLWSVACKANRRGKAHEALVNEVRTLLALGAEINTRTGDEEHEGYTPLCLVAQQGDAFLVRTFINEFNAEPTRAAEGETSFNNAPMHLAAEAGQLASVEFLRGLQIDLNVVNTKKETPLHLAARAGHVRIVKFLALWGADTTRKSEEGLTPLEAAEQGASSAEVRKDAQHALTIAFLQRCEVAPVCSEKALILAQADLALVDVCPPVRLDVPGDLVLSGVSDEDPLGEKSRGLLKGKPNDNLRSAAKSGNLNDAKLAVSEGADVRHRYDDKTIHAIALASQADAQRSANRTQNWDQEQEYRRKARNCGAVADYLAEVATTKLQEAVEQGNEARVAGYHAVGGSLDGLVRVAARSTGSVGIMHFLVTKQSSNLSCLWRNFDGPAATCAPYHVAREKKFDALAAYIRAQVSHELVAAVASNDLGHTRECLEAGGLPDFDGKENLLVAIGHGNVDLVRLLLAHGARIPSHRYPSVEAIETDGSLAHSMRLLLRQAFLNRALRLAAVTGDLAVLTGVHHKGADLSAENWAGATPLSLSLQYTHHPAIVHYVVSRGGTMLHHHTGVPSCIPLARSAGHPAQSLVEAFLKQALNVALFNAIMAGDLIVSAALCALGADLAALDEAGNSLVHTAVAFQGLDAVKWLTERGCPLNVANAQGEYAITAAVMKGDAATVEYMVHTNAGTKALKNGAGKTALDLAKEARYNRLVQLMDPGNKDFPVSDEDDGTLAEPSQEYEELIRAATYGQIDAIKIFIDEKYASLARKTQLAQEMVRIAETKKQAEVLRILVPHLKSLTSEAASDQTQDRLVSASAEQKAVLAGFLTGLTGLIAGGEVALDPSDPATYRQLFTNLGVQQAGQAEALQKSLTNPAEMTKVVTKEAQDLQAKMQKLEQEMRAMADSKTALQKRLQAQEAQLAGCKTALAKKECYKEIQEAKEQLHTLASSVALFNRASAAASKKKKTLDALKSQPNLLRAYATIENRLQGLFLACKTATSGMMSLNMTDEGDKRMTIVGIASSLADLIPVVGSTLSSVISVGVGALVTHLDKQKQQQEIANITTLANIEELNAAASNAAALVTYYYSAQIQAVITTGEKKAEESVPQLAEYLVLFMIDALQKGQVVAGLDLATQLWYATASQDPLKPQSLVDRLLGTPGDIKVRVKGAEQKITLRGLIGSVGVIDAKGCLYIPDAKRVDEVQKTKKEYQPLYSVSYLSAFTTETQVQLIVTRRALLPASGDAAKTFLQTAVRLSDQEADTLKSSVGVFQAQTGEEDDANAVGAVMPLSSDSTLKSTTHGGEEGQSAFRGDLTTMSLKVHAALATKGLVVTRDQVRELITATQSEASVGLELEVETLREDFNTKAAHYQTSIDAATETLTRESEALRVEHRAVQQELQRTTAKQLAEQQAAFAKQLAAQNAAQEAKLAEVTAKHEAQLVDLQAKMAASYAELQATNKAALERLQAEAAAQLKAVTEAQQQALASMVSSSNAAQQEAAAAKNAAEKASSSAEATLAQCTQASAKWSSDLQASKQAYEVALITSSDAAAKTISEYKAQLETLKEAAKTSAAAAKESASASSATAKEMKELRELQAKEQKESREMRDKELKALKEQAASESKALLAQAKDAEAAASKAADASKKAASEAKKAANDAEDAKTAAQKMEAKANK